MLADSSASAPKALLEIDIDAVVKPAVSVVTSTADANSISEQQFLEVEEDLRIDEPDAGLFNYLTGADVVNKEDHGIISISSDNADFYGAGLNL